MIVCARCSAHCLNALEIVAKDRQLACGCMIGSKPDLLRTYGYVHQLLVIDYEPLGMSSRRLRGRLFMKQINLKKRLDSQLDKVGKAVIPSFLAQHPRDSLLIVPPSCRHDTQDFAGIGHTLQRISR